MTILELAAARVLALFGNHSPAAALAVVKQLAPAELETLTTAAEELTTAPPADLAAGENEVRGLVREILAAAAARAASPQPAAPAAPEVP